MHAIVLLRNWTVLGISSLSLDTNKLLQLKICDINGKISSILVILMWMAVHNKVKTVKVCFVPPPPPDKLWKTHIYSVPDNFYKKSLW